MQNYMKSRDHEIINHINTVRALATVLNVTTFVRKSDTPFFERY